MVQHGNVVFCQTKPGLSKIQLTKKLADALEVLGIQRYVLYIDVYVDEFLGRRPTTAVSTLGKTKVQSKKPTLPHFPILQPLGLVTSRLRLAWNSSRSFQSEEAEIQYQVLHACTDKIHRLFGTNPWVLLVECSFQTRFDYVGLQQMSEEFDFEIHWLRIGKKGEMNAKFQSIIAKILAVNELKPKEGKSNIGLTSSGPLEIKTLHKNFNALSSTGGNKSVCTFDSLDVIFPSPPFLNISVGKHSGRDTSGSYTSCEDSSSSENNSAGSEIDFRDEVMDATMDFAKRLPSPDLKRYIAIANDNPYNNIVQLKPVFVVLVRDIFPGPASHISSLLKGTLQRKNIRCKRLVVSTLFAQPKSIDLMKHFALNQNSADFKCRLSSGCASLLINIIHVTLSKEYQEPIVIILDLEDERYVHLFRVLDFCAKIGQKALVLEKRPDGTFEENFNRVYAELKKGCIGIKKTRKLKLPKYNLTFIKEFLPLESSAELRLEDADLPISISSDLSHPVPSDSHSTVSSSSNTSLVTVTEVDLKGPTSNLKGTGEIGRQRINFIFQKNEASEEVLTSSPPITSLPISSTPHLESSQQVESSNLKDSEGISSPRDWLELVEFDLNMNEVLNPKTSTTDTMKIQGGSGEIEEVVCNLSYRNLRQNLTQGATVVTDEQSSNDLQRKASLNFPTPSLMCKEADDYVPGRTRPGMTTDDHSRQSLIQICRLPLKKRPKLDESRRGCSDSSEDSLFKGWVGIPLDVLRRKKPGLFSRFLSSIQSGLREFIVGPLRNVFRRTNRITPSQLIRRDWLNPEPTRTLIRRYETSTLPTLSCTSEQQCKKDKQTQYPRRHRKRGALKSA